MEPEFLTQQKKKIPFVFKSSYVKTDTSNRYALVRVRFYSFVIKILNIQEKGEKKTLNVTNILCF